MNLTRIPLTAGLIAVLALTGCAGTPAAQPVSTPNSVTPVTPTVEPDTAPTADMSVFEAETLDAEAVLAVAIANSEKLAELNGYTEAIMFGGSGFIYAYDPTRPEGEQYVASNDTMTLLRDYSPEELLDANVDFLFQVKSFLDQAITIVVERDSRAYNAERPESTPEPVLIRLELPDQTAVRVEVSIDEGGVIVAYSFNGVYGKKDRLSMIWDTEVLYFITDEAKAAFANAKVAAKQP
jgi:hypothetical protein